MKRRDTLGYERSKLSLQGRKSAYSIAGRGESIHKKMEQGLRIKAPALLYYS